MDKFENFNEEEKQTIMIGLVRECKDLLEYGVNGLSEEGKKRYNIVLSLLKEADVNKEYEYIYKNWRYV